MKTFNIICPIVLIIVSSTLIFADFNSRYNISKLQHQVDSLQAIQPVIVKEKCFDSWETNVLDRAVFISDMKRDNQQAILMTDITFVNQQCCVKNVDKYLVYAIIEKESRWVNNNLMQVTPICADHLGIHVDLNNRITSIYTGIDYLAYLKCYFKSNDSIIVAYNRGIEGMKRIKDLKNDAYYKDVMNNYKKYTK